MNPFSYISFLLLFILAGCSGESPKATRLVHPNPEGALSCAVQGAYGGTFVLTSSMEPKTFNTLVAQDAYSGQAISYLYASLVEYNPVAMEYTPSLASSWEVSEDGRSYTFHLRDGICWSDGAPITSDDIIFTFDAIFDERYPNRYTDQFTILDTPIAYKKNSETSITFTTVKPYAPFINDIGGAEILPKHLLEQAFNEGNLQEQLSTQTAIDHPGKIVGSGPFIIHNYQPGERIVYAPNPHYWKIDKEGKRLPYIDHLVFTFVGDSNAEIALFATGQTDASGVSPSDLDWVQKATDTYKFTIHNQGPGAGTSFIWFNQHRGKNEEGAPYLPPHKLAWFTDKNFRQAVSHGTNRQGILEAVFFNRGALIDSPISPANKKWHNPNTQKHPYDIKKAKELLRKSGFYHTDGKLYDKEDNRVEFELLTSEGSPVLTTIAVTFVENMKDLGIDVRLNYMDFAAVLSKTMGTFDYEASMLSFTGSADPSGGKAIYKSEGDMHLWHPNQKTPATDWEAKIDYLMDAQEIEMDESKRIELIHEMQYIFSEQLPLIFLFTPNAYTGIKNKWKNIQVPPSGSLLWNLEEIWTNTPGSEL